MDDDLGLNWYGFKWRNHDHQIGRFVQIDPLSEKYVHNSTYAFSENKVTSHVELEGLEAANANDVVNPYIRAGLKENVQKELNSMRRNGSEAVQVKGSLGAGAGVTLKVTKNIEITAFVSGPQAEIGINGAADIEAQASLAGSGAKVKIPGFDIGGGVEAGAIKYEGGKVRVNDFALGSDIKSSKSNSVGNLSQGGDVSVIDAAITIGVNLCIVGVSITVDAVKAGKATLDFFKAGANWMSNVIADKSATLIQKPDSINK